MLLVRNALPNRVRTRVSLFALAGVAIVLLGGCFDEYDYDGPIIGTALTNDTLYVEVIDVHSEVARVDITAGSALSVTYLDGFRTIALNLRELSDGSYTIRIRAEDTAGNLAIESLVYDRSDYIVDTAVIKQTYEPVFDSWGNRVAVLEAAHRRTTYTPRESGIPARPEKNEHYYFVYNTSQFRLHDVSANVTAYDERGAVLWLHSVMQASLAPGEHVSSGVINEGSDTPAYYTISMNSW